MAAEAALPKPPPAVEWKLEPSGDKSLYLLRNVGTDTATGVRIAAPPEYDEYVQFDLPHGKVLAYAAVQILIVDVAQLPALTEISVAWDGELGETRVPVPRGYR